MKRRAAYLLVVTLLAAAGLARLGVWQLDRAAEKQALQEAITARATLPVLEATDLPLRVDAEALRHRQARFRGRWLAAATVYLDNRPMAGRVGFIVVTPLKIEGRTDAIAVQRGWIPRDAQDRTHLIDVPTPDTLVEVEGRLAPEPSALFDFHADNEPGRIRQNLTLDDYSLSSGMRLLPLTLLQQGPPDAVLVRDWVSPIVNVQKNYGYAFQWFSMSALVVGLYVWFQFIRPARHAG